MKRNLISGQKERKESKILKDWIATIRTKISDNLKWEETNGKFKSVTNEILSHKSYKEYNSEGGLWIPCSVNYSPNIGKKKISSLFSI